MAEEIPLSALASEQGLLNPSLSEQVASEVLKLFRLSVTTTAAMTVALVLIDARFIAMNIIEPSERLMTENVIMAIIGASLVQVGAALTAIVYSLFRSSPANAVEKEPEQSL